MTRARCTAAAMILLLGLVGCASNAAETPTPASPTQGNTSMASELTWQDAKARTQAMELEIADSLPQDVVAGVEQMPDGVLIKCGDSAVNWHGATTVTLNEGTVPDPLVRELEAKYRDSRFEIKVRDPAPAGHYEVQLRSPDTAEIYIIGEGFDPATIRIASGSDCFPWPEDEYMGGKF